VITPRAAVDLSSAVPGVLESITVERSDRVEAGQMVAQLDSGVERVSVELAKARAAIESEIRLQTVKFDFDHGNRQRLHTLANRQVVSEHELDKPRRDTEISQWQLRHAREEQRLRKLELRRAEEALKQKTMFSPISGVVLQRFKSVGEYVKDQPILRIAQLDPLHVEAIAPMVLFGAVRPGMVAKVIPETVAVSPHLATVSAVARMGDAASGTFGIRLELPNPDHRLPAGLKCSVRIRTNPIPQAQKAKAVGPSGTTSPDTG
jgi:RND family efflux transporter MFP subunit